MAYLNSLYKKEGKAQMPSNLASLLAYFAAFFASLKALTNLSCSDSSLIFLPFKSNFSISALLRKIEKQKNKRHA